MRSHSKSVSGTYWMSRNVFESKSSCEHRRQNLRLQIRNVFTETQSRTGLKCTEFVRRFVAFELLIRVNPSFRFEFGCIFTPTNNNTNRSKLHARTMTVTAHNITRFPFVVPDNTVHTQRSCLLEYGSHRVVCRQRRQILHLSVQTDTNEAIQM
jgi:hypothetical protein